MFKVIAWITIAAAVAGTACGKKEEYPTTDDSWGTNKCVMKEEFQTCVASVSKSTAIPKNAVEQCESAARVIARTKERLIPVECKGW